MKYNVIEQDNIVIGKKEEILKYLKDMQDLKSKDVKIDVEDRIKEIKEMHRIITIIEDTYDRFDIIYLKRNWNDDLNVNYLETDLL